MVELSEPMGAEPMPAADSAKRSGDAGNRALHLMFGAQRMILEEIVFASYATLDRVRTETHLFAEFASKLAAAHSVHDWTAMGRECGQHHLEFIRRDCDRLFRHGERIIEATANLFDDRG